MIAFILTKEEAGRLLEILAEEIESSYDQPQEYRDSIQNMYNKLLAAYKVA